MNTRIVGGLARSQAILALAALAGSVAGSSGMARGQLPVLQGMSVTSYSISATAASPADPATLSFQSTDNPSFDPSVQFGSATGDAAIGTNWELFAAGADYSALGTFNNLVGLQAESLSSSLTVGDTASGQWTLSFVIDQRFDSLIADDVTVTTATLTPDGGSPVPLTPALSGTVFPVGTYTLDLAGELDDAAFPLAIAFNTTAVPEPATLGLAAAGLGCAAAGFWRRRRKRGDRSLALPPRFLN